jgi:hypothetical protein
MNRRELEHAIRAACDALGTPEVIVVGSQAILGEFPDRRENCGSQPRPTSGWRMSRKKRSSN